MQVRRAARWRVPVTHEKCKEAIQKVNNAFDAVNKFFQEPAVRTIYKELSIHIHKCLSLSRFT